MESHQMYLLPENWVHLLVGLKPVNKMKPDIRRRKGLYLFAVSRKNIRNFSQSSVSLNSRIGEVLSLEYMHVLKQFFVCLFVCFFFLFNCMVFL